MSEITELILSKRVRQIGGKKDPVFRIVFSAVKPTHMTDITERIASSTRSHTRHTLGDPAPIVIIAKCVLQFVCTMLPLASDLIVNNIHATCVLSLLRLVTYRLTDFLS